MLNTHHSTPTTLPPPAPQENPPVSSEMLNPSILELLSNFEPQTRITCGSTVVYDSKSISIHTGIDTMKLTLYLDWKTEEFLNLLDASKSRLQETEDMSVPFTTKWESLEWNLHRIGTKLFNFRLTSGDVTLLLNKRQGNTPIPSAKLEIGSLSSQTCLEETHSIVTSWLKNHGATIVKEKVAEIHLAVDFIHLDIKTLKIENQYRWIQRHNKFDVHYYYRKLTGIDIGKGNMMLRIYDKTTEMKRAGHKQEVFGELWGVEDVARVPVTRVEYQMRRPILREFRTAAGEELNTFEEIMSILSSLWDYCTRSWAKFMEKEVDRNHNQSKATCSEWWSIVQRIAWQGLASLKRTKQNPHKDIDMLRKQSRGLVMTIAAFFEINPKDIDRIADVSLAILNTDLRNFFKADSAEFIKRMRRKKNEVLASPDFGHVPF